jgi:hypothetical protein
MQEWAAASVHNANLLKLTEASLAKVREAEVAKARAEAPKE